MAETGLCESAAKWYATEVDVTRGHTSWSSMMTEKQHRTKRKEGREGEEGEERGRRKGRGKEGDKEQE